MSEVKGTLLTIIMCLFVFGVVFGAVSGVIKTKATEVSNEIAAVEVTPDK